MEGNKDKIPHYINDPVLNRLTAPENKLVRPKINYIRTVLSVLVFFAISLLIAFVITIISQKSLWVPLALILRYFFIIFFVLFMFCLRFIIVWFVRLYQRYAKSETRLRCCFIPSCSEYAVLALKKYGTVVGGIKTMRRLFRCHPPGGIDYP